MTRRELPVPNPPESTGSYDRFVGCLLGLAVGDALGGRFESRSAEHLRERFPTPQALFDYPTDELWYTDDTQMTIGVAEALIAAGEIVESELCKAFVANYVPSRGYGWGARAVLSAMEDGEDYRAVAQEYFPGGSYGNGAAMRVAPVGLVFGDDLDRVAEQARLSALPTHVHPLGIEGARVIALAVAILSRTDRLDRQSVLDRLTERCETSEFRDNLARVRSVSSMSDLAELGNGIEALHSVPTAVAAFCLAPDSYQQAVGNVILLGDDTDTLAAMTGALSGAYLGRSGLPARIVSLLETSPKGRDFLIRLAGALHEKYLLRREEKSMAHSADPSSLVA
jgi:poly(ADP-ribose) glycohydrolase ARH3